MFSTRIHRLGEVPVVQVFGEIDLNTVPELRAAIEEALGQEKGSSQALVVDLSAVEFMELMGLGLLVEQKERLREHGGELRLVLGGGGAGTILRLAEVEDEFAIYPNPETAVEDATPG